MSHFPDDAKNDPVDRFQQNECVDCGRRAELVDREKIDYWLSYAFEKGHSGEESYTWFRHDDDWRCFECATEFYPPDYDESN